MLIMPVKLQRAPIPGAPTDQTTDQALRNAQQAINALSAQADRIAVTRVGADYTALLTDTLILCNAAAPMTLTLPEARLAFAQKGKLFLIKRLNALVTIASKGGSIDGAATVTLGSAKSAKAFVSDGANWNIVGAYL